MAQWCCWTSISTLACSPDPNNTNKILKMKPKNLLLIFLFFLVGFDVGFAVCWGTGFFRPHDQFDKNRGLLLSFLASNVSARDGFYNASIGQGPDRVYALGMCIPGAEPKVCSNCIDLASKELIKICPNQTEGLVWPENSILCMVRYSNRLFFGSLEMEPEYTRYNTGDFKDKNMTVTEFDNTWEALMLRVIAQATSLSNPMNYGADIQKIGAFENLYGLVQCSKDISPWNCTECLRQSVDDFRFCCHGNLGGIVYRPSCIFRCEIYPFSEAFNLSPPPPSPSVDHRTNTTKRGNESISAGIVVAIVIPTIFLVFLALAFFVRRKRKSDQAVFGRLGSSIDITATNSLQFDFKTIEAATDNFSARNVIGRGGFGAVYKGTITDGTEVAVKRLSKTSGQGEQEFRNEVLLVAKLQHKNLVRLLGFSVEGEEKILVYEFVPNKSLDYFLFNPTKKGQLDWRKRYNIIGGITRGILYLHQDSRLTIIHRDLKASNILLDSDMNPKIADFGMARNFRVDQTEANTRRVVGTFGYMPPEYVANGQFSMKSDVYSFGVLVLEIIVGKRNSSFHEIDGSVGNFVTYVWRLWNTESLLELVDPDMGENYDTDEVIRCIHIGLLCVQENPADRPTMSTIFQMLTNTSIILPVPQQPGFFFRVRPNSLTERLQPGHSTSNSIQCSINNVSMTSVSPR